MHRLSIDMPSSSRPSSDDRNIPRRARHLTSIQVCNLSPFPIRDTFASALAQPSEQSQFTSHGKLSDDLDITVARKRGRGISSASSTSRNVRWEESPAKKLVSPSSHPPVSAGSPGVTHKRNSTAGGSPTIRPSNRPRALSSASFASGSHESSLDAGPSTSISLPSLLRDTSQAALEHIFQSRLVETCVTVTIPQSGAPELHSSRATLPPSFQDRRGFPEARRKAPTGRRHVATMFTSNILSPLPNTKARSTQDHTPSDSKSASMTLPSNDRSGVSSPQLPHESSCRQHVDREIPLFPTDNVVNGSAKFRYRSAIHRPSTNPSFNIDVRNEFANSTQLDTSDSQLHVEIWGHLPSNTRPRAAHSHEHSIDTMSSRKGKERDVHGPGLQPKQWRVLERWDVNLADLVPLSSETKSHRLPSNTLLVTLSPPGQQFYLPHLGAFPLETSISLSRPESPSAGYNSDPESDARRVGVVDSSVSRGQGALSPSSSDVLHSHVFETRELGVIAASPSRHDGWHYTANWQDLLKLTNLQAVLLETKKLLSEVHQEIDRLVIEHPTTALNREVSERRACIRQLEAEKGTILDESQNLRSQIDSKREALRIRRRTLEEARLALNDSERQESVYEEIIVAERESLSATRQRISPLRSAALAVLTFAYPIELMSPPDLLFAILDVPLPIPFGATDPAPPTSLPAFKDISEDSVATALGYAAQVVQLLAAYMNKNLTYPITCVGSRSLIKDGISAMVGPRMFPLFSKGVDTYRFEYGVFLLNKDIEMLMIDRELRALDMRHTLPNLKNLLLTLTDPESTPSKQIPSQLSFVTDSILHSPVTASSMLSADDAAENNVQRDEIDTEPSPDRPSELHATSSGATTPTSTAHSKSTITKKSRTFLDLAPLAGFLRSRYPSTSRVANSAEPENGESSAAQDTEGGQNGQLVQNSETEIDDEDDRRTIRIANTDGEEPAKVEVETELGGNEGVNGSVVLAASVGPAEKLTAERVVVSRGQVSSMG